MAIRTLKRNEVQLWRAKNEAVTLGQSLKILNEEERQRAKKFRFENDRRNFTTGRALLRILIGQYLNISQAEVEFHFGDQGKPYLPDQSIRFNLSHSGNHLIIGFSLAHEIGVDLEYHRKEIEVEKLASHFFSEQENTELASVEVGQKLLAFYSCWTRKEAIIKALGGGLSIPLKEFSVAFRPGENASLKNISWQDEIASDWKVETLNFGSDYVGAIAVKSPSTTLKIMDWSSSQINGI